MCRSTHPSKSGARAHWAVLCGVLRPAPAAAPTGAAAILVHSMSRVPLVCDLAALLASNAQLRDADARKAREGGWVVGNVKLAGAVLIPPRRRGVGEVGAP